MFRTILIVCATLAIITACGGDDGGTHANGTQTTRQVDDSTPDASDVVASTPLTPAKAPPDLEAPVSVYSAVNRNVRLCRAEDLNAFLGPVLARSGGSRSAALYLGNLSDNVCAVEGRPRVEPLNEAGEVIPLEIGNGACSGLTPCDHSGPLRLLPGSEVTNASFGVRGWVAVRLGWTAWRDALGSPCAPGAPVVTAIRVSLPDGGLVAPVTDTEREIRPCHGQLSAGSFYPIEISPPPGLQLTNLEILPSTPAIAGQPLNYRVKIGRDGPDAFAFTGPCPSFRQTLASDHKLVVSERFQLNCRPVESIRRWKTSLFEWSVDIPADLLPGKYTLNWSADLTFFEQSEASVSVEILSR